MRSNYLPTVNKTHSIDHPLIHVCCEFLELIIPRTENRLKLSSNGMPTTTGHKSTLCSGTLGVSLIEVQLAQVNSAAAAQQKAIRAQASGSVSTIRWIETLLQTPIADHRKYCLWRIFAPYFANVRCLSNDESEAIVRSWLLSCSKLRRLEGRPNYSFRYNLSNARRVGYYPISLNNLRKENPDLFGLIHSRGRNNKICGQ